MIRRLNYSFDGNDPLFSSHQEGITGRQKSGDAAAGPAGSLHQMCNKAAGDDIIPGSLTITSFLRSRRYSRHLIAVLKRTPGGILRNGRPARASETLCPGDRLDITIPDTDEVLSGGGPRTPIPPAALPLSILYEDEDLLVIDKPPFLPVHPAAANRDRTLANALARYCGEKYHSPLYSFHCVNRLDRDTSGLLILALNSLSSAILSQDMALRAIHRHYLAITEGETPPSGTISAPIARVPGSALRRWVDKENGEPAVTHFRTIASDPQSRLSLVLLRLDTGRTHQIRVHMQHIGHPVIGDFLYHPDDRYISRQALHSCSLEFTHPVTGQAMSLSSPLPEDMASIIRKWNVAMPEFSQGTLPFSALF